MSKSFKETLLLDPGVIPKIKDPLPVPMIELHRMIGRRTQEIAPEDLSRCDLVKIAAESPGVCLIAFRAIHVGTVSGDGKDGVFWA